MPLRTWYFAPKVFSSGELCQLLKDVIGCFSPHPNQTHLAVNFSMPDGWDIDKEWSSFEDLEAITNLAESGLSIRAWFQSSNERLYLGIGGDGNVVRITISADTIDSAKRLLETLLNKLELVEVRNPLDEHIERMEKLDECPYDFARIVRDSELASILISRWKESNHTYEAQSYLATIILLGSILEGALLDKVQSNPKEANQANTAPKYQGKIRPFDEWTVENLIAVGHDCGWLDKDVRDFSIVLRDYRNLVHPRQQKKLAIYPDAGTCKVAREVVGAALEDLMK